MLSLRDRIFSLQWPPGAKECVLLLLLQLAAAFWGAEANNVSRKTAKAVRKLTPERAFSANAGESRGSFIAYSVINCSLDMILISGFPR